MNPVAFEIFGISIRWYGIIITIAFLIGIRLVLYFAKKEGFDEDALMNWFILLIPSVVVGARIWYVIFSWSEFSGDWLAMINTRNGGLAIHGGIFAGVLVSLLYCRKKQWSFWQLADLASPSLVLGQAIGRWANYINQEAHGGPTDLPWGIMVDGVKVHPTFLYESLWNFALFLFLLWYRKRKKVEGEIFLLYAALYSVARLFIEQLRTDSLYIGSIRTAQLVSVIVILSSMGLLYYLKNKKIKK